MHKEAYDVSRTKICGLDKATAPAEAIKESSVQSEVTGKSEKGVSNGPLLFRDDGEVQAAETLPRDLNHLDDDFATDARITKSEMLIDSMELDEVRAEGTDPVSQSVVSELDMQVSNDLICEDGFTVPDNLATEANLMEKEVDDGVSHLSPDHILNEQSLNKNCYEANVLVEGEDVVPALSGHNLVVEAGLHSADAETNSPMENCIMPRDHGDISSGTALAIPEEHDCQMLVEDNEDTERFKKPRDIAETDFPNSGSLKDDFGHSVEHGDTHYAPVIDDEGERLQEDMGSLEVKATDGRDVSIQHSIFISFTS